MSRRRSLTELRDLALDQESKRDVDGVEAVKSGAALRKKSGDQLAKRNKWVQLNILVPSSVRQRLKMRALQEECDMSDLVVGLLEDYLAE